MDSMIRSEEKSDLFREVATTEDEGSRSSGTKPPLTSGDTDLKSTDSLTDSTSSLLTNERLTKRQDSAASTST